MFQIRTAVTVEHSYKSPSRRYKSTDQGLIPGRGTKWQENTYHAICEEEISWRIGKMVDKNDFQIKQNTFGSSVKLASRLKFKADRF